MEGSEDRVLEATLRQDEPAPAPGTVKVAAMRIVPATMTSPPRSRVASASATASLPRNATLTYAAATSSEADSGDFLSGRGLY
jgi:hypothetical protein